MLTEALSSFHTGSLILGCLGKLQQLKLEENFGEIFNGEGKACKI